jgi:hypothetical protein
MTGLLISDAEAGVQFSALVAGSTITMQVEFAMTSAESVTTRQLCLLLPLPPGWPTSGGRHIAGGVCGVAVVNHRARVFTATLCADEYLDFRIKNRILWLDQFEPQLAIAELAVHGWRRLDEVTHM